MIKETPPIVICTTGSPSLQVLEASVRAYSPNTELIVHKNERSTFGQAYNAALEQAFQKYDEVIISNDDVVITPNTMQVLMEDVEDIKRTSGGRAALISTMCDNARPCQNIRFKISSDDNIEGIKWKSENFIKQVPIVAPIFAWMSKRAFQAVKFPPITWWSDDVICEDLKKAGFLLFISRAYVHHAMSMTVGDDYKELQNEALPWVEKHRPEYVKDFLETRTKGFYHG